MIAIGTILDCEAMILNFLPFLDSSPYRIIAIYTHIQTAVSCVNDIKKVRVFVKTRKRCFDLAMLKFRPLNFLAFSNCYSFTSTNNLVTRKRHSEMVVGNEIPAIFDGGFVGRYIIY